MFAKAVVIFLLLGAAPFAKTQSGFPTVARTVQQARDEDRRLILDTELQAERQALVAAQAALAAGPTDDRRTKVHRHEQNVEAILREINGISKPKHGMHETAFVVKARPAAGAAPLKNTSQSASFWNPYNRARETGTPIDSSTVKRREIP
jgi:hypothetical protein